MLCCVIAFFRKKDLWFPVVALVATKANAKMAHELYLALKHREENVMARADRKGGTELRRRRRKKSFDYTHFYNKVMAEMSLYSTCGAPREKNGEPKGDSKGNGYSQSATGARVNEAIKAEVMELLAGQRNLVREQQRLLEHHARALDSRLPANPPFTKWQPPEEPILFRGQANPQ